MCQMWRADHLPDDLVERFKLRWLPSERGQVRLSPGWWQRVPRREQIDTHVTHRSRLRHRADGDDAIMGSLRTHRDTRCTQMAMHMITWHLLGIYPLPQLSAAAAARQTRLRTAPGSRSPLSAARTSRTTTALARPRLRASTTPSRLAHARAWTRRSTRLFRRATAARPRVQL